MKYMWKWAKWPLVVMVGVVGSICFLPMCIIAVITYDQTIP